MSEYNDQVCQKIISEMKAQGITRKDLSQSLSITYNQVCNILNHRCALTIDRLYDISNILDIPISSLYGD